MYIVISNRSLFPESMLDKYYDTKRLSVKEFVTIAMSEEGFSDYDEGLLIDVTGLTEELYDNLSQYELCGIPITYYRIDNESIPRYIDHNVEHYSTKRIKNIDMSDDECVLVIYDDGTKVSIDTDTYKKYKTYIQIMDYFNVVKLWALEVWEDDKWDF